MPHGIDGDVEKEAELLRMGEETMRILFEQAKRIDEDSKLANARVQAARILVEMVYGWRGNTGKERGTGFDRVLKQIGRIAKNDDKVGCRPEAGDRWENNGGRTRTLSEDAGLE